MNFFKILSVVSAVSAWAAKASADGKIDTSEALELVSTLVGALGLAVNVNIPSE